MHYANSSLVSQKMLTAISLAIVLIFIGSLWSQSRRKHGQKLPPGPRPLPIIGNLHMLTTLPHRGLQNLAKKYGPIMSLKFGHVQAIVVSSPQAAELILKTHDATFASRPKIQASEYLNFGGKGMVLADYGEHWRNVRKLCTMQLLTTAKVESFAALRRDELGELVESLKKAGATSEAVDVSAKVAEVMGNMMSRMILGRNTKDDRYDDLEGLIVEGMSLVGAFNLADYVPYTRSLDLQVCLLFQINAVFFLDDQIELQREDINTLIKIRLPILYIRNFISNFFFFILQIRFDSKIW